MTDKLKVGILGATGMVGQRFITLLDNHPWFEVVSVAASPRSAGKKYSEAVEGKWKCDAEVPSAASDLVVKAVEADCEAVISEVDFVFSALDLDKEKIREIEELYAAKNCPVVSNNSAHRWTEDVPMIIPEVNPDHCALIDIQKKKRGWEKGFITVKPNCSIQSYVPILKALEKYGPKKVIVTTFQAISGAGKTFETWPEMVENVIPLIGGEEGKSEKEPLKVLGSVSDTGIVDKEGLSISATCIRAPVIDGHMASVDLELSKDITQEDFVLAINNFDNPIAKLELPSAPNQFLKYFDEEDRPQTKLDVNYENGMGVTVGRLRKGSVLGWKFVALSHNTIRGAAGGAVLVAELLKAKGYL